MHRINTNIVLIVLMPWRALDVTPTAAGSSPQFTAPLAHAATLLDRRPQWGS